MLFLVGGPTSPPAAMGQEPYEPHPSLLEAVAHYTGASGRMDDARARALLLEAVAAGDPLARMWVARVHSRGRMNFPRDTLRADSVAVSVLPQVRRLADAEVAEAVFLLGTAYDEGLGVVADPAAAAGWHRRAAEMGHMLAQHNLGNQLAAGRGVPRDPAEAVRWWLRAADAGDAVVMFRLGEAYEEGLGVPREDAEALRWYRRAAARGYGPAREALLRLGGLSLPGGVPG